jgi:hypothetical protein
MTGPEGALPMVVPVRLAAITAFKGLDARVVGLVTGADDPLFTLPAPSLTLPGKREGRVRVVRGTRPTHKYAMKRPARSTSSQLARDNAAGHVAPSSGTSRFEAAAEAPAEDCDVNEAEGEHRHLELEDRVDHHRHGVRRQQHRARCDLQGEAKMPPPG